jgi:hypothetical protein
VRAIQGAQGNSTRAKRKKKQNLSSQKPQSSQRHEPDSSSCHIRTNMPSAVSVPDPSPAFTLTFGGVDFRLDQKGLKSGSQVSFQSSDDGVIVNLKSFTGTLRVSLSSFPVVTSAQSTTAKVEEEPASPDAMTTAARKGVSPTQQQLPFAKAEPKAKKSLATKV